MNDCRDCNLNSIINILEGTDFRLDVVEVINACFEKNGWDENSLKVAINNLDVTIVTQYDVARIVTLLKEDYFLNRVDEIKEVYFGIL